MDASEEAAKDGLTPLENEEDKSLMWRPMMAIGITRGKRRSAVPPGLT
jgi:hypothetical protein